jgi:hypothetical protein
MKVIMLEEHSLPFRRGGPKRVGLKMRRPFQKGDRQACPIAANRESGRKGLMKDNVKQTGYGGETQSFKPGWSLVMWELNDHGLNLMTLTCTDPVSSKHVGPRATENSQGRKFISWSDSHPLSSCENVCVLPAKVCQEKRT